MVLLLVCQSILILLVLFRQVWNLSDDSQQLMISTHFQPTYEKDNYLLRGPPLPNLNGGWPKPKPHIRGEKRTMREWEERDEQEVVDSDRLAEVDLICLLHAELCLKILFK